MTIVPKQPNLNIAEELDFEDYPTDTFYIDPNSRQIRGMVSGLEAMRQAVEVVLNVERFQFQIYSPNFGIELEGLIGQEQGYIASELQRRIKEALDQDERITDVTDFEYQVNSESMNVKFRINTVYGDIETGIEVVA